MAIRTLTEITADLNEAYKSFTTATGDVFEGEANLKRAKVIRDTEFAALTKYTAELAELIRNENPTPFGITGGNIEAVKMAINSVGHTGHTGHAGLTSGDYSHLTGTPKFR